MSSLTLREFLAIHPDYRAVTREPRRCARLVLDPATGATVLEEVTIREDYIARMARSVRDSSYGTTNGSVYVTATARTHSLGEQAPYFSLTGDVWTSAAGAASGADRYNLGGGMMHETILRTWPQLQPIADLHLADAITGEPMHALANGWYFYCGKARAHEDARREWQPADREPYSLSDHVRAANALRVAPEELPEGLDEAGFREFVASLAGRWAREAAEGRALILRLAGEPAEGTDDAPASGEEA